MMALLHKTVSLRHLLIILFIAFMAYANTLLNGFIGDDNVLFVQNNFYNSLSNIPRIFDRSYSTSAKELFSHNPDRGSGSVAYRPVLSLSYFMDAAVWGKNPFGYHLTSFLIHLLNSALVYFLFCLLFGQGALSFWAALIFSVHPIQTEAVSVIGFRADLLGGLWILLSSISWIVFRRSSRKFYFLALFFYFLALFSKESTLLFPLLIVFFERTRGTSWKKAFREAGGFALVAVFYLYAYFVLFPNTALHSTGGYTLGQMGSSLSQIWIKYVSFIVLPILTVPFPGLYAPMARPLLVTPGFWIVLVLVGLGIWGSVRLLRSSRPYLLMVLWAVFFFLPGSGLIPQPNPAALRYLYLPSIGISLLLAAVLLKFSGSEFLRKITPRAEKMVMALFIGMCLVATVINNGWWKDNFRISYIWVREFPDSYKAHLLYAYALYDREQYAQAAEHFEIALSDPRAQEVVSQYFWAMSYFEQGQDERARMMLEEILRANPSSGMLAYRGLAAYYERHGDYPRAAACLEKLIQVDTVPRDYVNLVKIYRFMGDLKALETLSALGEKAFAGDAKMRASLDVEIEKARHEVLGRSAGELPR